MFAPRDLPLLPVFVAVATAGSFTAAGRDLGLAKSVVSQHIRTLEERCGVRLLERSTRRLSLTQVGAQVLDAANEVLASVRSLEQVVEGHHEVPTGTLRVTLPLDPALSAMISPLVAALTRKHESLKVELNFDDAVHDLVAEGLDVAIRLGSLRESSYVVHKLGSEDEIIVASPAALDALGSVDSPRQLANAPWVSHSALGSRSSWTFRSQKGLKAQIGVNVVFSTNTVLSTRDLLLAGGGFGVIPTHVVLKDVKEGRLAHVCPGWFHRRLALHALLPTRHAPPRVRVLLAAIRNVAKPLGFEDSRAP